MKFLKKYKKKLGSDLSKLELKTAYPLNLFTGEILYTHIVEFYGSKDINPLILMILLGFELSFYFLF
jgi:hypothetical protein